MPIYQGASSTKLYLGADEVLKAYLGSDIVYEQAGGSPLYIASNRFSYDWRLNPEGYSINDEVTSITNQSSNNSHTATNTPGSCPLYTADGLFFEGAERLFFNNIPIDPGNSSFSMLLYWEPALIGGIAIGNSTPATRQNPHIGSANYAEADKVRGGAYGDDTDVDRGGNGSLLTAPSVVLYSYNSANINVTVSVYDNAGTFINGETRALTGTPSWGDSAYTLGSIGTLGGFYDGLIKTIDIFDEVLSPTQETDFINYILGV
jgi:hypothetical protein